YSASFTLGNQIELKKKKDSTDSYLNSDPKLGYIFSLSYKTDYKYYDDMVYGEFQRSIHPEIEEMQQANMQTGELGGPNSLIGALGGLGYTGEFSKIRVTLMPLQNGESRAGKFTIENKAEAVGHSGFIAASDTLEDYQRG